MESRVLSQPATKPSELLHSGGQHPPAVLPSPAVTQSPGKFPSHDPTQLFPLSQGMIWCGLTWVQLSFGTEDSRLCLCCSGSWLMNRR